MLIENSEGYYNIAGAIIKLAVKDYRNYREKMTQDWERMGNYEKKFYISKITELEKFFVSPYGMTLSSGAGDIILEKLHAEFQEA